jgi:hypothetical protein
VSRDADVDREISRALPGSRSDHAGMNEPCARAADGLATAAANAPASTRDVAREDRNTPRAIADSRASGNADPEDAPAREAEQEPAAPS